MTSQEILEYNKRCAEFLGMRKDSFLLTKQIEKNTGICHLRFHLDWNLIMEVVEKIQTLDKLGGIVMIQQGRCKITSRMAGDNSVYADVSHYYLHGMKKQKEAVVQAINQFLIWYNDSSRNN